MAVVAGPRICRELFTVGMHLRMCLFMGAGLLLLGTNGTRSSVLRADEPPTKARETGEIFGKIVDAAGNPLPGVKVSLHRLKPPNQPHWGPWTRWGRFVQIGAPVVSDENGSYRFPQLSVVGFGRFMLVAKKTGFADVIRDPRLSAPEPQHVDLVLKPPVAPVIQLTDQSGQPVTGARVREFEQRGANGDCLLRQMWLKSLGMTIPPSDEKGHLHLPPLPAGDSLKVTIDHPRLAPVRIDDVAIGPGIVAQAKMKPGVSLTLRVPTDNPAARIQSAVVDLRHEPVDHPSTTVHYEIEFDTKGAAQLTVEPGNYQCLLLQHADFLLTPTYMRGAIGIEPGRNDNLQFEVHRKVLARGRVMEADTWRPVRGAEVMGEIAHGGPGEPPADEWNFAGWADANDDGTYQIALAAGPARVMFDGAKPESGPSDDLISETEYVEFNVAADGSTVIPDIRVRPLPKFTGVVRKPDGSPAPRCVVCFLAKYQPVLSNEAGRFEIQPKWIPIDGKTGKRQLDQDLVAFDPYRPLAARSRVRLDKSSEIVLTLEPHDPEWPFSVFPEVLVDWERGIVSPEEAEKNAEISLRGRVPPELDGVEWINTDGKPLTLASLHGKYVLLDFWYTACGPCRADLPSVKLVHELYKDKGVVVIGVHTNAYDTLGAVRDHVAEIGLPFPVVVDFRDGRMVASYQRHGISNANPSYILLDPKGKVLLDDRTIPHPSLHGHKLEIIRKFVLAAKSPAR